MLSNFNNFNLEEVIPKIRKGNTSVFHEVDQKLELKFNQITHDLSAVHYSLIKNSKKRNWAYYVASTFAVNHNFQTDDYSYSFFVNMDIEGNPFRFLIQEYKPQEEETLTSITDLTYLQPIDYNVCLYHISEKKEHKNINKKLRKYFHPYSKLSSTEQETLKLIMQGYDTPLIAQALFKGKETVKGYRKNILKKYQVSTMAEVINITLTIESDI